MTFSVCGHMVSSERCDVVARIDLDLRPGSVIAVIRQNGAGKFELVRALAGVRLIKSGSISLDDIALPRDPKAIRRA